MMEDSLWGTEFNVSDDINKTKKVLKKIAMPKVPKVSSVDNQIKSKKLTLEDKLILIRDNVLKALGKYKANTIVIRSKADLILYINKSIENKIIAIDTETNNSLDPLTCKIMGACLYTPGALQAYVPINHIDYRTGIKLDNQLTEQDLNEQLSRLNNTIKIITHNGSFDYQVIKCTCKVAIPIYWDTMIAARLLNENERSAGLKQQYIDKIDSNQERYSIDSLFDNIDYAVVDPEIFALYSAFDAYMTYALYMWQKEVFEKDDLEKLYKLFLNVEMPLVTVTAEMELNGIGLDLNFSKQLSIKYKNQLVELDKEVDDELLRLKPAIEAWKLSADANKKPLKRKKGEYETIGGPGYIGPDMSPDAKPAECDMYGKSRAEQLSDPVNLASPTQLAILLYDVLKVESVSTKTPRGTGEEILEKIDLPLCKLILERRGLLKLINTYIDKMPSIINPVDSRIHCHFKQTGTDTGRFASDGPNLQNIPAHNKEIRMMFTAREKYNMHELSNDNNEFCIPVAEKVETTKGWINIKDINIGDIIFLQDDTQKQIQVQISDFKFTDDGKEVRCLYQFLK